MPFNKIKMTLESRDNFSETHASAETCLVGSIHWLIMFCLFIFQLINLYSMVTGQINHSQVILMGFFSLVNALINPILYAKMSQRYRKGYIYIFKKILSVCGGAKPDGSFFGKWMWTSGGLAVIRVDGKFPKHFCLERTQWKFSVICPRKNIQTVQEGIRRPPF